MTTQASGPGRWGVASPHHAASDAAAAILAAGGTAVDGALAAAGVLTVVYPHNCSVGGDLIGLVRRAGEPPRAVFGVGRSAGATDSGALRRQFGERVPVTGPFSINVPGVVSGWKTMHELGGSLGFARLLEPAITLASEGVAVSPSLARALNELDSPDPALTQVFGPPSRRLRAGEVFAQPQLAETLAQIAADPECYYRGGLAEGLAKGLAAAGSPITLDDLNRHQAVVTHADATEAGSLAPRLFTAGLPSQGVFFAALARIVSQLLADGYDLLEHDAGLLGRAFGDVSRIRDDLLCDPSRLPDMSALGQRLAAVDLFGARASTGSVERPSGASTAPPSGDTVAVVTYDEAGNSVSMLQSLFHGFGSQILDPTTGVLFHNRQSMFTLRPGAPGELGPGLMPPHTLCPVLVDASDGTPSVVLSTMGGRAQPQILTQVLLRLAERRNAGAAVAAPRFVVGGSDSEEPRLVVTAEQGVSAGAVHSLAESGFDVEVVAPLDEEVGHAQLLLVGAEGVTDAASDPRSDGEAIVRPDFRRP